MAHEWIDQGLRQMRQREEQLRLASERRLHQAAIIKEKGADLMGRLLSEVGAAVDWFKQRAPLGGHEVEFEALPHEGFCVTRANLPRVSLECRPGYETHVLYCNLTRSDSRESGPQEFVFSLSMTVDDSDAVVLSHETRAFQHLEEVLEFLLKPVLFPALDQEL